MEYGTIYYTGIEEKNKVVDLCKLDQIYNIN